MRKKQENDLQWAVPPKHKIPPDPLELRIDFHSEAIALYTYEGETTSRKIISAQDLVHTIASSLTFSSGLLPRDCLWWANTSGGPEYAFYEEPRIRKLAIQFEAGNPPQRYTIPLPGILFLCSPGRAPKVFAVKRRPAHPGGALYSAPMLNTHGDITKRSKKYPENHPVVEELDKGKFKKYPMDDLVQVATVGELIKGGQNNNE